MKGRRASGRRRSSATRAIENELRRAGFVRIAGVDEVGRGCLAGPVVAAAVVLPPDDRVRGLRDSKLLTPAMRDRLHDEILERCLDWSVGMREPADIDRLNIHHASLAAMREAVVALHPLPDFALVDAFRIPSLFIPQRGVVGGDRRCAAIAAASVVAKVVRDRRMQELHQLDPRYGFDRHKGYATPEHLAAMARHGYSPVHRRSFRPRSLFDTID
ncbi:MAG: ribonuclease HII [Acidobacteriota bacterium]|nr:ribonuclease HII [Acidobacteriota bacterium]